MRDGLTFTTRAGSGVAPMSSALADRRVVGDALDVIAEPSRDLGQVVRILQVGVRERREHAVVQRAQRLRVLHLEPVLAFEVDRVDRAGRRDLVDECGRPGRLRVELEAHARRAGEPPAHVLDRGRLAEAQRVDEAHRPRLEAEHVVQGMARLAQREVQRRRLERPVAKAPRRLPLRRLGPQIERREVIAEAGQRPLARERQRRLRLVQRAAVLDVDRDVLPEPVGAGADQPHVRRHALELVGEDGVQPVVLARLDDERQLRQLRPERFHVSHGLIIVPLDQTAAPNSSLVELVALWELQNRRHRAHRLREVLTAAGARAPGGREPGICDQAAGGGPTSSMP